MSPSGRDELIKFLVANYLQLTRQLTDRLGSAEIAHEGLHDAYVRLHREDAKISDVKNPKSYLYKMILNIAKNRTRDDRREQPFGDPELISEVVDDAPDQHRVIAIAASEGLVAV